MVEDCDQGGEKDDYWEDTNDKNEAHGLLLCQSPKQKFDAPVPAGNNGADQVGERAQHSLTLRREKDKGAQPYLKEQGPGDGAEPDGTPVRGKNCRNTQKNNDS